MRRFKSPETRQDRLKCSRNVTNPEAREAINQLLDSQVPRTKRNNRKRTAVVMSIPLSLEKKADYIILFYQLEEDKKRLKEMEKNLEAENVTAKQILQTVA